MPSPLQTFKAHLRDSNKPGYMRCGKSDRDVKSIIDEVELEKLIRKGKKHSVCAVCLTGGDFKAKPHAQAERWLRWGQAVFDNIKERAELASVDMLVSPEARKKLREAMTAIDQFMEEVNPIKDEYE